MTLVVPDAETALRIFLAIEERFAAWVDKENFPKTTARDKGDRWEVYRWSPNTEGGGQLQMEIAKCDGAVSGISLSR